MKRHLTMTPKFTKEYVKVTRRLTETLKGRRGEGYHIDTPPWKDRKGVWHASLISAPPKSRVNTRGQVGATIHSVKVAKLRYEPSKKYWRFVQTTRKCKHPELTPRRRRKLVEYPSPMTEAQLEQHLLACTSLKCKYWALHRFVEMLQEAGRYGYYSEYLTYKRYDVIRLTEETKAVLFRIYIRSHHCLPVRQPRELKLKVIKRHARPRKEGSMSRVPTSPLVRHKEH